MQNNGGYVEMDITMLYYVGICLLAYLLSRLAERTNRKIFFILAGAVLILYSGLRGYNVGIDTVTNYYNFNLIKRGYYVYMNEKPFLEMVKLLLTIFDDPAAIIFIMSAFTIGLFFKSYWKLRDEHSVSWMVLIFVCFYFARSMNIARQFLAWAVSFYGVTFLLKKKTFKSFICMAVSICIHLSSIASFAIFGIYILQEKSNKSRHKIVGVLLLSVIVGSIFLSGFLSQFERAYVRYYTFDYSRVGLLSFYKILTLFAITYFAKNDIGIRAWKNNKINNSIIQIDNKYVILYFIGIIFDSLAYFSSSISRVGLYFLSFELLFWGKLFKSKTDTGLYKILLLIMLVYLYINNVVGDGYGIFPYSTIFAEKYF